MTKGLLLSLKVLFGYLWRNTSPHMTIKGYKTTNSISNVLKYCGPNTQVPALLHWVILNARNLVPKQWHECQWVMKAFMHASLTKGYLQKDGVQSKLGGFLVTSYCLSNKLQLQVS